MEIKKLIKRYSLADGNSCPYLLTSAGAVVSLWTPDPSLPKLLNDRLVKSVDLQTSNDIKLSSNSQPQTDNIENK